MMIKWEMFIMIMLVYETLGMNLIIMVFIINEKCYVHNIFTTNHRWLVVISSNLNLILRLLFCQIGRAHV